MSTPIYRHQTNGRLAVLLASYGCSLCALCLCLLCMTGCRYARPLPEGEGTDSQLPDTLASVSEREYLLNINLEVVADSVSLACLPLKDCFNILHKGDKVVVAEVDVHPSGSADSIRVKLAHSQELQGWVSERQLMEDFVPVDSISQFIYVFSDKHVLFFVVVLALFAAMWVFRISRRMQLKMVYFNDIDSFYPLLLCVLMAFCATVYETVQICSPVMWEHYYFKPTLSPLKVPFALSVFLIGLWLLIIVLLATLDEVFRRLSPAAAAFYLLGLFSCCIFCYFFFIFTTRFFVGYLFFAAFCVLFVRRARVLLAKD